ncbi:MAG: cyclic nucleotide-binding domain-containing protein [Acidobacteria bacterium]|nr:cyclic nucleotide-binding domain-containing protein [Acidobacteriota bacterium]MCB9399373.1 cyclic nucleotide-binding domain-containing protein [Acidobacteriota bacterium]
MSFWSKLTGKNKTPDQLIMEGNLKGALKLIMEQLRNKPDEPTLLLKLADLYVRMGDTKNALKVYIRIGDYFGKKGFFNKSVAAFKKALNLDPENEELLQKMTEFNEKVPKYMINSTFLQSLRTAVANEDQTMVVPEGEDLDEADLALSALPEEETEGEEAPRVRRDPPTTIADNEEKEELPSWDLDADEAEALFADIDMELEEPSPTPSPIEEKSESIGNANLNLDNDFWDEEIEFDLDATLNAMEEAAEQEMAVAEIPPEPQEPAGVVFKIQENAIEEEADDDDPMFNTFDDAIDSLFRPKKNGDASHVIENKKHWPIFRTLPKDALVELIMALETKNFAQGQVICRQGERSSEMFLITEGKVQILMKQDAKIYKLATLGSGDFFGEGAMLTSQPRNASVLALEDTEVLILKQDQFQNLVNSHPEIHEIVESIWITRSQ